MKHFLKETHFAPSELGELFALARSFKKGRNRHTPPVLQRQSWGMLFFKNSTRTRISFEVGINELGGTPVVLSQNAMQLNRGESIADTARIMSRYLHGLVIRCYGHDVIEEFAAHATVPVINALTDFLHPCQIYSDAFSMAERWAQGDNLLESLKGRKVAFFGDTACNMANSWILGGALFGMEISLCGPKQFAPSADIDTLLAKDGLPKTYVHTTDPAEAAKDADVIYTDVWVSMGDESEEVARIQQMEPYTVTADTMAAAKPDALFMHCLPAHPGMEVTQEVLDSDASIIFDQAENRLHMQKAIMAALAEANR